MNFIVSAFTFTRFPSVVLGNPKIVKKCYNESPEFACRLVGGKPAMITATNIMKYSKALKSCNASSAIVGGWNGESGLFVLTDTNTLTPYEPINNTSSHVICDNVDKQCNPPINPCVMPSENHRERNQHSQFTYQPAHVQYSQEPERGNSQPPYCQSFPYKPYQCTPLPAPNCMSKPNHCYPVPAPCPPRPCPPIPYPPRPCIPIPYPEHNHGHHHPHHKPTSSSSSCLSNSGSHEQLCALVLASLLKSDSKTCLAPLLEALKSDDTNLLCCNKLCDSNLVIDPAPEPPKPKPK